MHGYVVTISIVAGICVFVVLVYLVFRIYKRRAELGTDAEIVGLCPPSIILTSDSPGMSKKRLYSPIRERAGSMEKDEKLQMKEKRKDIKSLWLPKKKTSLPVMQATMVQPAVPEQTKDQGGRGRLTFTLHYHYQYALKSSVLLVKLASAQQLPPKDNDDSPDVFVKTQLVPSCKRVYISKVHRGTSNPVFDETYEFDIEYQELQQQRLLFEILDYDCMSRYKPIGEVSVLLAELGTHGFNILREISLCVYISRPQKD